jgi:hypothetical protein
VNAVKVGTDRVDVTELLNNIFILNSGYQQQLLHRNIAVSAKKQIAWFGLFFAVKQRSPRVEGNGNPYPQLLRTIPKK